MRGSLLSTCPRRRISFGIDSIGVSEGITLSAENFVSVFLVEKLLVLEGLLVALVGAVGYGGHFEICICCS